MRARVNDVEKVIIRDSLKRFLSQIKYHQESRKIYGPPFFLWRRIQFSRISAEETEGRCAQTNNCPRVMLDSKKTNTPIKESSVEVEQSAVNVYFFQGWCRQWKELEFSLNPSSKLQEVGVILPNSFSRYCYPSKTNLSILQWDSQTITSLKLSDKALWVKRIAQNMFGEIECIFNGKTRISNCK